MNQLFQVPVETLDGYTPKFSRTEILLGYRCIQVKVGGGLGWMQDYDEDKGPEFVERHEITILGHRIESNTRFWRENPPEIVVKIANEFMAVEANKLNYPHVWNYISENGVDLNNSRRYWDAVGHREEIEKARAKALDLLDQVRRGEWVASMYAAQVKAERWFTKEEKALHLAEVSGGEYEELK